MSRIAAAMRIFAALAIPYFRSEDRWPGRGLAAGIVILECALVGVAVAVNQWSGRFFNALEARDWDRMSGELIAFVLILIATVATGYAQYWLGQHFQIRWRTWMTKHFVDRWMADGRHYRIRFLAPEVDNIHLRIANDISIFIQKTHEIGSGLIGVAITLASFIAILWGLSATTPLPLLGHDFSFPGYLIAVALVYAGLGTLIAHLIGRRLVGLNFNQQRREADLRFATARATDRSDQIAVLHAEPVERGEVARRVGALMTNWRALVRVQGNLTAFTYGYAHVSSIFPTLVVAPAYMVGAIPLGTLMQAALAFQKVEGGFSYLINAYGRIAEWKAVMDRLWQLDRALAFIEQGSRMHSIATLGSAAQTPVATDGLVIARPDGSVVVSVPNIGLPRGARMMVTGTSGSGKSLLFRTLSGVWPFGGGRVGIPPGRPPLVLEPRPYFPLGTLRAALAAPTPTDLVNDERLCAALADTGLDHLRERLDEENDWAAVLSGGEQQRLGFARVLIQRPAAVLIDDATSALADADIRELYRRLAERLPGLIVMTAGRSDVLAALHETHLDLSAAAAHPERAAAAAAATV